jgi:thiamine biosynthesis protein ThiI
MPILRPLIGDDKIEIVDIACRIGTYEISIMPDQDCCSLFVPKHPETRAHLPEIETSESRLDVAETIKAALAAAEVVHVGKAKNNQEAVPQR